MAAGWKFAGVFKRGRETPLCLECVVALSDLQNAQKVAKQRLIGADEVTVTELSKHELKALKIEDGADVFL
jgi:hypothetical protein